MNPTAPSDASLIARLLATPGTRVHMLGIAGIGMAGLAMHLQARGCIVTGCDCGKNDTADRLRAQGIPVADGHNEAHITADTSWVIRSAAVPEDAPELRAARTRGIPVHRRGEVLPELLRERISVAVSGTHGKTTTSSFVTRVLCSAGRAPGWCIGGDPLGPGSFAAPGDGKFLVVEADESDGTVALYAPDIAVVTNIDFDHMEHFATAEAFRDCFRALVARTRRAVVYCGDDPTATAICAAAPRAISYGLGERATVRATAMAPTPYSTAFTVTVSGRDVARIELPVPGRHNLLNALAAFAVGSELGLSPDELRAGLASVALPRRRFERVADAHGIVVLSDYAHHPAEIAALVGTAVKLPHRRLVAVFQPHRYTRTLALGDRFPEAFRGVDLLVLTPVYAASEAPIPGGSTLDLYAHFARAAKAGDADAMPPPVGRVLVARDLANAWAYLSRLLRPGDILLVVGAGDVEAVGGWARAALERAPLPAAAFPPLPPEAPPVYADEPLGTKTTLHTGGVCDLWARIRTVDELGALARWTRQHDLPLRVMGAGSNVLPADTGVRGVVVRLTGTVFRRVELAGSDVIAGAAVPVAVLLNSLQEHGLSGLEFLEGIPATVGGCVAMNAGAWGHAIGERISWIRCLNTDGAPCIVQSSELSLGYRACGGLGERIVLEVALRVTPAQPEVVAARRRACAARREWLRGKRTAGSVFKNPAGTAMTAGRLLDEAGLKGRRVGGAVVCEQHANVIETRRGATASDVLSLMEQMRQTVRRVAGVELEPELRVWW